jgi:protein CpxP
MSLTTRAAVALAAATAAFCLSSSAFAQEPPPPGAGMHHGADHAEWRKAHEERRARFLHDVLNLRPDQEGALQAFLADMKPQPHERGDRAEHKAGDETALTTPERLDHMAAAMARRTAEHQAAFQRRADAIKRFYAVLSPDQKRAFDALHSLRGGPHGGPGHEGPGGGHHEGGPGEHRDSGEHEHGDAGEAG